MGRRSFYTDGLGTPTLITRCKDLTDLLFDITGLGRPSVPGYGTNQSKQGANMSKQVD